MKVSIDSKVKQSRIAENRKAIQKAVEQFNGKNIRITIEEVEEQRSLNLNAYYWLVIVKAWQEIIETEHGDYYSKDKMHSKLKEWFNAETLITEQYCLESNSSPTEKPKSTSELSNKKTIRYHNRCRVAAKDFFNVDIPLPNEKIVFE